MINPNAMCNPPKHAAISMSAQAAGEKRVITPNPMKNKPMTGITFTETVPAVTIPAP